MGVPGYCDGGTGHGVVDDDGVVYLPKGWCGEPWLAISDDEGLTWERVRVAGNGVPVGWLTFPFDGVQDHEAGVGVDPDGNVYYFWMGRDRLPYLAVSTDGGRSWSQPRMVGAPDVTEATHPALVVGGVGQVAVAYVGSTNSPGGPYRTCDTPTDCLRSAADGPSRDYRNVTWNGYIGVSRDALADDPLFYTAPVNDPGDPLIRGPCRPVNCQELFHFIDVEIGPDGSAWAPFVDGCQGPCATGNRTEDNADEGVAGRLFGGPRLDRPTGSS